MKIRVFEAFAGYGSQAVAAKRLQRDFPGKVEFEFVGISEIESAAVKAYRAIHGPTPSFGDISKIDWASAPDFELFTYSFPCQDISNAGRRRGLSKGSQTRSSLLWECEKAIAAKRPRFLLMENVKALVGKKNMPDFLRWIDLLDDYGYSSRWQVLNAKDFGIPQNRERVFLVSILRTDADPCPDAYKFPEGFSSAKCAEDYMLPVEELDPGYFDKRVLNEKALSDIISDSRGRAVVLACYNEVAKGMRSGIRFDCVAQLCNLLPLARFKNAQTGRLFSARGISPCLCASRGCCNAPKYLAIDTSVPLTQWSESPSDQDLLQFLKLRAKIRLLHEREALRLMDLDDADIDKILGATEMITLKSGKTKTQKAISKMAAYKLAGNSIVVACLYHIFRAMFIPQQTQPNLFTNL